MKADSQVSIVIPNYNGMAFMEACMQAVLRDAPKAELIVVDNASKDGSLEYTREHFPEVRVLAMDQNYGFARAVNEGIRAATRPYVILLNNDTEVEPGFTDALVGALEADVRAFSAQAKLIQLQDPLKLDDAGNFYCALGWAFARGKDKPSADYEEQDEVLLADYTRHHSKQLDSVKCALEIAHEQFPDAYFHVAMTGSGAKSLAEKGTTVYDISGAAVCRQKQIFSRF